MTVLHSTSSLYSAYLLSSCLESYRTSRTDHRFTFLMPALHMLITYRQQPLRVPMLYHPESVFRLTQLMGFLLDLDSVLLILGQGAVSSPKARGFICRTPFVLWRGGYQSIYYHSCCARACVVLHSLAKQLNSLHSPK